MIERSMDPRAVAALPPLPRDFYTGDTEAVARRLLGKGLFVRQGRVPLLVEIVEVEAYLGAADPASHAFIGPTPRNQSMFSEAGTCYVYLSYGVNYCMNVVTQPAGTGEGVLLRAAEPLLNVRRMALYRGLDPQKPEGLPRLLLNGPGKLTQGLGIDLRYNGRRYDQVNFKLVDLGLTLKAREIGVSPRVGISKAKSEMLRFFVKDSPWLSRRSVP